MAGLYGMNVEAQYICIFMTINGFPDHPFDSDEEVIRKKRKLTATVQIILKELQHIQREESTHVVHLERGRQLLFFYPMREDVTMKEAQKLTKCFSDLLYDQVISHTSDADIKIGIGGTPHRIEELNKSFQEAQKAISLTTRLENDSPVSHYNEYLIQELLSHNDAKEKLEMYYKYTLSDLVSYDQTNKTDLLSTLETYYQTQGNIEQASQQLFIHRNTLVYRLNKIMSLLDVDLKNAQESFKLQFGFIVKNVLQSMD